MSGAGADDEDVLLAAHAVHLSQDMVDDTVRGAAHRPRLCWKQNYLILVKIFILNLFTDLLPPRDLAME